MTARKRTVLLVLYLVVGAFAPAGGQTFPRPDPQRGSIGVTVHSTTFQPSNILASEVYFAPFEDDEDKFAAEYVMPSNHFDKGQFYLLNARPGRYVVVAARFMWRKPPSTVRAFFSRAVIQQMEVTVRPGTMVFAGDLLVTASPTSNMGNADPAQAHYYRLISPEIAAKIPSFAPIGACSRGFLNKVTRDADSERKFWLRARDKVFKKQREWAELANRQLEALALAERQEKDKSQVSTPQPGKED
ncbi:MAG: hypothetical protein GY842_13235 [bacterium]|nr:hypothetical protein [bacterium]